MEHVNDIPWFFLASVLIGVTGTAVAVVSRTTGLSSLQWDTHTSSIGRFVMWTGLLITLVIMFILGGWTLGIPTLLIVGCFALGFEFTVSWTDKILKDTARNNLEPKIAQYVGREPPGWIKEVLHSDWHGYSVVDSKVVKKSGGVKGLLENISDGVDKLLK